MPKVTGNLTASGLTPKKQRFVDCFCVCLNGTQAVLDAKFTKDRDKAGSMATYYLNDPAVSAEIRRRLDASTQKSQLTIERIDQEIAALAFADIRKLYDEKGELLPMSAWPDDIAAAVGSIEMLDRIGKVGRPRVHKLKIWDKTAALTLAGKRLNAFTEKIEHRLTESFERLVLASFEDPATRRAKAGPDSGGTKE